MITTGLIGSGKKIEILAETLGSLPDFRVVGFHSNDPLLKKPEQIFGLKNFSNPWEMIAGAESLIISDHPGNFTEIIDKTLKNSKHVLIFPDISLPFQTLEKHIKIAEEAGVILHLHFDGRSSWIRNMIYEHCGKPEFINVNSSINSDDIIRGISIFDTAYEEIYRVLKLNPVNPRKYMTSTIPYCSPEPNYINVRIDFENGTTANISVNKFRNKDDTKIEIFRQDKMVEIDRFKGNFYLTGKNPNEKKLYRQYSDTEEFPELTRGIRDFISRIQSHENSGNADDSGIIAHKIAAEIIFNIIPLSSRKKVKANAGN